MELENVQSAKAQQHGLWIIFHDGFYPIISVCGLIVIIFVVIHFRGIQKFSKTSAFYDLNRQYTVVAKNQPFDMRVEMWIDNF